MGNCVFKRLCDTDTSSQRKQADLESDHSESEDCATTTRLTRDCDSWSEERRKDCLSWEEFFMGVALLSAQRSKDPVTQVGACIVNSEKRIVNTGYNGMPLGCSDDNMPWGKNSTDVLKNKQLYVCHAEMNAVVSKSVLSVKDCVMYVTLFPCNECAKVIIQSGIKQVIYLSDKYAKKDKYKASRFMLEKAGIKITKFRPKKKEIVLSLDVSS